MTVSRILVFDIFGTVVDWHGTIVRELRQRFPQVDADAFAVFVEADHREHTARADLEAATAADAGLLVDVLDELRRPGFAAGQRD